MASAYVRERFEEHTPRCVLKGTVFRGSYPTLRPQIGAKSEEYKTQERKPISLTSFLSGMSLVDPKTAGKEFVWTK